MEAIKHFFTKHEQVEVARYVGGHVRYWTETQCVGIDWMMVASVLLVAAGVISMFKTKRL